MTLFPSASQENEHVLPRLQDCHHPTTALVGNSVLAAALRADVRLQLLVSFSVAGHCSFVEFCQLRPVVLPRGIPADLVALCMDCSQGHAVFCSLRISVR